MTNVSKAPVAHANNLAVLAAIVIIVVAIAVVYVAFNGIPPSQKSGTNAPPAIAAVLSQGHLNTYALESLASNYTANHIQFHVNYSGTGKVSGTGLLSLISYSIPISVKYSKYNRDSRFDINLTNIPFINSIYIGFINDSLGNFECTSISISNSTLQSFNVSAYKAANITHLSCMKAIINSTSSNAVESKSVLNGTGLSSAQMRNMSINLTEDVQSSYNGMPCTFISGKFAQLSGALAQQSTVQQSPGNKSNVNGVFSMCISNQYDVPLTLNASLTPPTQGKGKGVMSMYLNIAASSIGDNASDTYITTLPGPIVNITSTINST